MRQFNPREPPESTVRAVSPARAQNSKLQTLKDNIKKLKASEKKPKRRNLEKAATMNLAEEEKLEPMVRESGTTAR